MKGDRFARHIRYAFLRSGPAYKSPLTSRASTQTSSDFISQVRMAVLHSGPAHRRPQHHQNALETNSDVELGQDAQDLEAIPTRVREGRIRSRRALLALAATAAVLALVGGMIAIIEHTRAAPSVIALADNDGGTDTDAWVVYPPVPLDTAMPSAEYLIPASPEQSFINTSFEKIVYMGGRRYDNAIVINCDQKSSASFNVIGFTSLSMVAGLPEGLSTSQAVAADLKIVEHFEGANDITKYYSVGRDNPQNIQLDFPAMELNFPSPIAVPQLLDVVENVTATCSSVQKGTAKSGTIALADLMSKG